MKSSGRNSENSAVQQIMGHDLADAAGQTTRPTVRAVKGWSNWEPTQDLAAKHPMGRGVIAAAAEAMKKPR